MSGAARGSGSEPAPVDPADVDALVARLRARRYDEAVIFTSFHQSPLPMALLLPAGRRAARRRDQRGLPGLAARRPAAAGCRRRRLPGRPRGRALRCLAAAAGLPPARRRRRPAAARAPPPSPRGAPCRARYVVVHPGASVPARASAAPAHARDARRRAGRRGLARSWSPGPAASASSTAPSPRARRAVDLGGRTDLAELAARAAPAPTPSSSATPGRPTWPPRSAPRWCRSSPRSSRPRAGARGACRTSLLGDQEAACRGTRARECPVPGPPVPVRRAPRRVAAAVRDARRDAPARHVGAARGRRCA